MAGQTSFVAVRFERHPASLPPADAQPDPAQTPIAPLAMEPWSSEARYAVPGPAWASMAVLDARLAPPPPLPELAPPRPADDLPRCDQAALQTVEPVDVPPERRPGTKRPIRLAAFGAGLAVAAGIAAVLLLPRVFATRPLAMGVLNAPVMVLRAAGAGRVTEVSVTPGQTVGPATALLTIQTAPPADPAAAVRRARIEAARTRLSALDHELAQPVSIGDAGRTRVADLREQRAEAAGELASAQEAAAQMPPAQAVDRPILAGVHGLVRSLEVQSGAETVSGLALIRLLDCDQAFLTVPHNANLRPGQAVRVRVPGLPVIAAQVRQSVGVAEPPDSLVIPVGASLLGGACPVGAAAVIGPAQPQQAATSPGKGNST